MTGLVWLIKGVVVALKISVDLPRLIVGCGLVASRRLEVDRGLVSSCCLRSWYGFIGERLMNRGRVGGLLVDGCGLVIVRSVVCLGVISCKLCWAWVDRSYLLNGVEAFSDVARVHIRRRLWSHKPCFLTSFRVFNGLLEVLQVLDLFRIRLELLAYLNR